MLNTVRRRGDHNFLAGSAPNRIEKRKGRKVERGWDEEGSVGRAACWGPVGDLASIGLGCWEGRWSGGVGSWKTRATQNSTDINIEERRERTHVIPIVSMAERQMGTDAGRPKLAKRT